MLIVLITVWTVVSKDRPCWQCMLDNMINYWKINDARMSEARLRDSSLLVYVDLYLHRVRSEVCQDTRDVPLINYVS
jgi:hypothetical protein